MAALSTLIAAVIELIENFFNNMTVVRSDSALARSKVGTVLAKTIVEPPENPSNTHANEVVGCRLLVKNKIHDEVVHVYPNDTKFHAYNLGKIVNRLQHHEEKQAHCDRTACQHPNSGKYWSAERAPAPDTPGGSVHVESKLKDALREVV